MTAQQHIKVNLLPNDRFEYSKIGRFLQWSLSAGRHAVVLTELVVISAFLSRFWFDRQLDDLRQLRIQKVAIVESFGGVQKQFEQVKTLLTTIQQTLDHQYGVSGRLDHLQALTPAGIEYTNISVSENTMDLVGYAPGSVPFSLLLTRLQDDKSLFDRVAVTDLRVSTTRTPGYDFALALSKKAPEPVKPAPEAKQSIGDKVQNIIQPQPDSIE